jgi:hypothetical protein
LSAPRGASVTIAGVDTPLPVRLVKLLLVAFGDDMFAEADVPDSDDVLVEDDIKARLLIWNAVIDDVCKSQTATVLSSEKLRFAAWFRALYQGVVGGAVLPKSKCWICQSDGHLAATCSTAKGKELREKKLSSAVKPAAEAK